MSKAFKSKKYWYDLWLDAAASKKERDVNYSIYLLAEIEKAVEGCHDKRKQLETLYFELNDFAENEQDLNLIQLNTKLFTRLVISGLEFMNLRYTCEDLLYLGAMIDLKIKRMWNKKEFYTTISGILKKLKKRTGFLTDDLKIKIRSEYQKIAPDDFSIFFS